MKLLKNVKVLLLVLGLSGLVVACSDDDSLTETPTQGRMSISAKASYSPFGGKNTANRSALIELNRFLVNFKEIELEFDDVIDEDNIYGSEDEIELRGPFEMDLLNPIPIPLVNITLPNGKLEEIEFEFDKSTNAGGDLFNQSMRMEGTIDGAPFVFWHDFEEEIELEFEDGHSSAVIIGDSNEIIINFDLSQVLNATPSVDLSTAVDGNGDGIIEISPQDEDGNNALAEALKQAIKNQIELLEDLED